MNNRYEQVVERYTELKADSLTHIHIELEEDIAALRTDVNERVAALATTDPTLSEFATLVSSMDTLLVSIEALVKASDEVEKLRAAVDRALDRAWKQLRKLPAKTV